MSSTRSGKKTPVRDHRYTIDASVFVNAFHPYERGHAESLRILALLDQRGDPIIVPTLMIAELASAVARARNDTGEALRYAKAVAGLRNLTLVALTNTLARRAADMAAEYRLRGADAVYLAVAKRYDAILLSRDEEQLRRGSTVTVCQTPEEALHAR